jgi:hypothetical protein
MGPAASGSPLCAINADTETMSQLNFFMTKEEMRLRLEDLLSTGLVTLFFGNFFDTNRPAPILTLNEIGEFDDIIIWVNNDTLEPKCSSRGIGDYKDKFLFDYYKDPIIELDNCSYSPKIISPGRLFYKTGYIENESVRQQHIAVAKKAVRIFSKNLLPISKPFKISPQVKNLIEQGYQIELGRGGRVINKTSINST